MHSSQVEEVRQALQLEWHPQIRESKEDFGGGISVYLTKEKSDKLKHWYNRDNVPTEIEGATNIQSQIQMELNIESACTILPTRTTYSDAAHVIVGECVTDQDAHAVGFTNTGPSALN
jgi:hypothetical protein